MQSLLARIFLSFWLIIGITIGLAAIGGYYYAERMRQAFETFEISDTVIAASTVLDEGGREGLETWLRRQPKASPVTVFILDRDGTDILGRRVPRRIAQTMRRFGEGAGPHPHGPGEPPNLRPARPFTQLVGPGNEILTMFVVPKRNVYGEWANEQARPLFLLVALIVSAAVSYALASAISRPVRKFREATVAIAEGDLGTRIADSVGKRRDEIGMLARDIDSMANKLELAAEQQTELTRNISHELRSPLARMRVALELARRQAGDLAEFSRIESETERLDDLIGQILSYSRMQARTDETAASLDLAELVQEVVENVNFECRSAGIDGVSVELTEQARPIVSGFAGPLTSAVENVLRNAVRHSPTGGLVSVRLFRDDGNAVLRVRDQGPGVAADELDSLFEPFYRTRESLQRDASQGTGLGLAIARRAVQKNGGSIEARNADDGGLCIDITLPIDDASA